MFKTLFALGLKFGLAAAEKDARFDAFKLAYNELDMGSILTELAQDSENDLDDKAVAALNAILEEKE